MEGFGFGQSLARNETINETQAKCTPENQDYSRGGLSQKLRKSVKRRADPMLMNDNCKLERWCGITEWKYKVELPAEIHHSHAGKPARATRVVIAHDRALTLGRVCSPSDAFLIILTIMQTNPFYFCIARTCNDASRMYIYSFLQNLQENKMINLDEDASKTRSIYNRTTELTTSCKHRTKYLLCNFK